MKTTLLSKICTLAVILTMAVGCSSGSDDEGGGGGSTLRPDNQPQLNSDVKALYNLYSTIATFGYAPSFDISAKQISLSNGTSFTIKTSTDTPSFTIYADKDTDGVWYWKYEVEGAERWLTGSDSKQVSILNSPMPIFNTDSNNNLMVSLDKGQNYDFLLDPAGSKITLAGKHSGLFKATKGTSEKVTITLVNDATFDVYRKPDQRGALEALYDACDGPNWAQKAGWKLTDNLENWYGITCNSAGDVTKIDLRKNKLTGTLPEIWAAFPKCTEVRFNNDSSTSGNDNDLSGQLPQSMRTYLGTTKFYLRYNHFDITDFYVPNDKIDAACKAYVVYPQREDSYDFRLFINSDVDGTGSVHEHASCVQVQKASKGKGVDIYFIGDGYDKENHTKGGTLDFWLDVAIEATFSIHPMDKLREYFNIFIVYGHSTDRGVGLFNNKRNCLYGYHQSDPMNKSNCSFSEQTIATTIEKATGGRAFSTIDRAWICMVVNSMHNSLYRGMQYSKTVTYNGQQTPIAVGINPTYSINGTTTLLQHEFVGHAMGRLLDEYGDENSEILDNPESNSTLAKRRYNITYESDPAKSPWADFYKDQRYAHEKLGCYAGAWSYGNLYRPTTTSMMRGSNERIYWFNAPSRKGIYSEIMQRAFTAWQFDYEEFVKFDEPHNHIPPYED